MKTLRIISLMVLVLLLGECKNTTTPISRDPEKEEFGPGPPPFARVKSPEFNADGTITFRIWAPRAAEVRLQCEALVGDQSDKMERFDEEYWRITVEPSTSGIFHYVFLVDGVRTPDPLNALTSGNSSVINVHGKETCFFRVRHVPHGTIHRHFYHNPGIETVRSCHVYVPAEYNKHPDRKYPVLFLLHGSGETDESWFSQGKANFILDNLIADNEANPMIVVAPYGHTVEPGSNNWPFVKEQGDFIQDFNEVLVPYIRSSYRISENPCDWAMAGFSMGGYHTLKIGLNQPDRFGHLGVFSWGGDFEFFEKHAPVLLSDPLQVNQKFNTIFIACGKDDFLFARSEEMDSLFTDLGIEHIFHVTDKGHTFRNWRNFLYHYARAISRN